VSRVHILKIIIYCFIVINGCIPVVSSENIHIESDHPYKDDVNYKVGEVSSGGADRIKLHFVYLKLAKGSNDWGISGDRVIISDENDNQLDTFEDSNGYSREDFWTGWYSADKLKIILDTDESGKDDGFVIDKYISSNETFPIASDHPYKDGVNYKVGEVSSGGADRIKLHFVYLKLAKGSNDWGIGGDRVIISDEIDNQLDTFEDSNGYSREDFWIGWYSADKLKIILDTDESGKDDGFVIDKYISLNETDSSSKSNDNSKSTVSEIQPNGTGTGENKILTNTELNTSANSFILGQSVTLAAKVDTLTKDAEEPSGTVNFMDGSTLIGTEDVNSGKATLTTSSLSSGSHSITAEYSGDNYFESSKSPALTLNVLEQADSEEQSDPEIEQPITREQTIPNKQSITAEKPSEQNSSAKDILLFISENSLVSGLILLVIGFIIQNKKNKN
jgi:hypothetical protein